MSSTPLSHRGALSRVQPHSLLLHLQLYLSSCLLHILFLRPPASLLMPFPLCPSTEKLGTLALISLVLDILGDLGQCLSLSGPQFSHVCSWG